MRISLPLLVSFAASALGSAVVKRQTTTTSSAASAVTLTPDDADEECENTATTRACWGNGFSIATDFDDKNPDTGKTVTYNWDITNTTKDLDGTGERIVFLVDNQYPGPTLYADWGDTISVTINNKLENNGTGIHWHGLRQLGTNDQDGVPGITECPIAPGASRTYTFKATQFGTSWYHSHWSVQYGQGVLGPIVINGPATANYDEDLGPVTLTDWYNITAFAGQVRARSAPPEASNGLINGTMVSPNGGSGGAYYKTTIEKGKKYRIRIINTSVDSGFMVSLDNHPFSVITSDFVPIKPYTAEWIFVGIGQRYDVVIEANQTVGNYWFRAYVPNVVFPGSCGSNQNADNIQSIFHYSNASNADPTSTAYSRTDRCTDEQGIEPYWDSFVPSNPLDAKPTVLDVSAEVAGVVGNATKNATVYRWGINLTAINVDWDLPILEYVQTGNTSYPESENLVEIDSSSEWTYWVLQEVAGSDGTQINLPHPIHLHGHDFYVLGANGDETFTSDMVSSLNFNNPPRRDTATLPSDGWLVIAFQTDNPGAWIMHCHIAWHVADGLAAQFLESKDQISFNNDQFNEICQTWNDYYPEEAVYIKDDSGV